MEKRVILLHCHIFKNAGSTIDEILKRNFGHSARFKESNDGQFLSSETIVNSCLADSEIRSLSSHKIALLPPRHPQILFIPLVMIRNPLDRLGSIYSFYRRQKSSFTNHECTLAKRLSFKEFVEIHLHSGNDSSFANLQTQFFLEPGVGLSEKTWPLAEKTFLESPCVGLVEKFDESMVLWAEYLTAYFTGFDFSYLKANASGGRANKLDTRLAELEASLGEVLCNDFRERNEFDYRLYSLASEKVDREISKVDDFFEKLRLYRMENKSEFSEQRAKDWQPRASNGSLVETSATCSLTETPILLEVDGAQLIIPRISREKENLNLEAEIIGCGLFDRENKQLLIAEHGKKVAVWIAVTSKENVQHPIVGITLRNRLGETILAMNSNYSPNKMPEFLKASISFYCFQFIMPPLNQGSYSIAPAIAVGTQDQHAVLGVVEEAVIFFIPAMSHPRLPGVLYLQDATFFSCEGIA